MNVLVIKNIKKSFHKSEIVKGISFEVEKGRLLALLGPSGCGKTTTLRMIAGIETPDDGEIRIDGMCANQGKKTLITQKQRHIGMVFQDLALWPHMTVYQNIEFGLKAIGLSRVERRKKTESVLSKVNMHNYANEYPSRLSGGQQQLVAIARAIVTEPKLLLMDEPLSNIDVRLRDDIRKEIKRIQQEMHITTVYVTHDQEDAFLLADKVAVMNKGILEQTGTPEEIYSSPGSLFVAGFVGESNVINVKISGKDKILTPWGELIYKTKGYEKEDAFLFFRPHHVKIEKDGLWRGTVKKRDFMGECYRYLISTSGCEIILKDPDFYEVGQNIHFTLPTMKVFSIN